MLKSDRSKSLIVIFVLLSTLLLGPLAYLVGTILMWKLTRWPKWVKIILSFPFILIILSLILGIFYLFVAKPHRVVGLAMFPNYKDGEFIFAKVMDINTPIRKSDVIIFSSPSDKNTELMKRIIAISGDKIEIKGGNVYLNNSLLKEPYLSSDVKTNLFPNSYIHEGQSFTLPSDQYFVLGDNREHSLDSREFGLISKTMIHGMVWFCYWNCK